MSLGWAFDQGSLPVQPSLHGSADDDPPCLVACPWPAHTPRQMSCPNQPPPPPCQASDFSSAVASRGVPVSGRAARCPAHRACLKPGRRSGTASRKGGKVIEKARKGSNVQMSIPSFESSPMCFGDPTGTSHHVRPCMRPCTIELRHRGQRDRQTDLSGATPCLPSICLSVCLNSLPHQLAFVAPVCWWPKSHPAQPAALHRRDRRHPDCSCLLSPVGGPPVPPRTAVAFAICYN